MSDCHINSVERRREDQSVSVGGTGNDAHTLGSQP